MSTSERDKLMAAAIYEIRLLLSGSIGSSSEADPHVRLAAHLAYALHNEALAIFDGDGHVDIDAARKKIARAQVLVGESFSDNGGHLLGRHLPGQGTVTSIEK